MISRLFPKLAMLTLCLVLTAAVTVAAPIIGTQPTDTVMLAGSTSTLSVAATGAAPLTYRWDISTNGGSTWAPVSADAIHSAPNQAALQLNAVPLTWQNRRYRVAVTDASSTTVISNPATLTVEYSELWGMGSNANGQLGDGTVGYVLTPERVNTNVIAVATGSNHTLFLKQDGSLWAAGWNQSGQLGDGTLETRATPVKIAEQVTKITAGGDASYFIKTDGTLWACGINTQEGQLPSATNAVPIQIATQVTAVAAGNMHLLFIKTDGTLWGRGSNTSGQLGLGGNPSSATPIQIASDVASIAAGSNRSFFIKTDGVLWGMGFNHDWALGISDFFGNVTIPAQISSDTAAVASGSNFSLFLKTDGTVWACGFNLAGQIGNGTQISQSTPVQIATDAVAIETGSQTSYIIKTNGTLVAFGRNSSGQIGDGTQTDRSLPVTVASDVAAISGGSSFAIWVKTDGSTWGVGYNVLGQLGNGLVGYKHRPTLITDSVISYVARGESSLFVKSDGSLWGLGQNDVGQLGDGTSLTRSTPVQITTHVASVTGGAGHTLYVKTDGSLWGTGRNTNGQLGDGTQTNRYTPVQIATGITKTFSNLASNSTYFLKDEGDLWAVGDNSANQFGNGSLPTTLLTPQLIRQGVQAASAGGTHMLYTTLNDPTHTLWAVGRNFYGEHGNAHTIYPSSPQQVATDVIKFEAGSNLSFFFTSDGILRGTGANYYGQLGNGAPANTQTNPVESIADVASVSPGSSHSLFVKVNGTLWAAGANYYGMLGDGTTVDRTTSVQVATQVSSASSGTNHSLFLKRGVPEAPFIITQPQSISIGTNVATTLIIDARGMPTPQYQWRKNGEVIAGANNTSLSFPLAQVSDSGNYDVVITNSLGTVTSQVATLTVAPPVTPSIVTQPIGAYQIVGGSHSFSVKAAGTSPLAYQWFRNGNALVGQTTSSLALSNLQLADAGSYTVTITNALGSVTSGAAALHVENVPAITTAPAQRINGNIGQPLSLTIAATSTYAPLTYQWKKDNRLITGAVSATYNLSHFSNAQAGAYTVEITDAHGFITRHTSFVLPDYAATQVRAWGNNNQGQLNIPDTLTDVAAISAGGSISFAIKKDGTVTAWGGNPNNVDYASTVSALTDVVEISGGLYSALILKSDGTVQQLRHSGSYQVPPPAGLTGVIAVAKGFYHGLALKSDGTVVSWSDPNGQTTVPAGLSGVTAIAAGGGHSLALKTDGTVVAWGPNNEGQISVPSGLTGVIAIAADANQSIALKSDGTVVQWGRSATPTTSSSTAIASSWQNAYAIRTDGSVVAWGDNAGLNTVPTNLGFALKISAGVSHVLVLRDASTDAAPSITTQPAAATRYAYESHTLNVVAAGVGPIFYQWRQNGVNIVGATQATLSLANLSSANAGGYDVLVTNHAGTTVSTTATLTVIPLPVVAALSSPRQVLSPGQPLNLSVTATGTGPLSYQWFRNGRVIAGATQAAFSSSNTGPQAKGYYWVRITDSNGSMQSATVFVNVAPESTQLLGWGTELYGDPLIPPPNLSDVISLATSPQHRVAIRRNGSVAGWGYDQFGRLNLPANVSDAVAVSASVNASYILHSNGTVSAATNAVENQTPANLSQVVAIDAHGSGILALKSDGTVVAWGSGWGEHDVLGFDVDVIPADLNNVSAISLGGYNFAVAVKRDGHVVTWGSGITAFPIPAGLSNVVAVATGYQHIVALKDDGTVVAWGRNQFGATDVPAGLSNVVAIDASEYRSVAVKSDGTVVYWGSKSTQEPAQPAEASPVIGISLEANHVFALRDATTDATTTITSQPLSQILGAEAKATFSVTVSGVGPFNYQWRKNGANISGANTSSLIMRDISSSDAGSYDVVITNYAGSITSNAASLTVMPVPVITSLSPTRHVHAPGENLNLSVTATGTGVLQYQWTRNGHPIAGATSANLSIATLTLKDSGYYLALVTDANGTKRSAPIFVTVAPVHTQIVAWGRSSEGQTQIPIGLDNATAIAGGSSHAIALDRAGKVHGWGYGSIPPSDLQDVVAISAGSSHFLALKSDGTVTAWGNGGFGETVVPAELTGVVAVAAGNNISAALKSNGMVVVWGANSYGYNAIPSDLDSVTAIWAGNSGLLALRSDRTVVGWSTKAPVGLDRVVAISGGGFFFVTAREDGSIFGWDREGGIVDRGAFPPPNTGNDFTTVAGGQSHTLGLRSNGTVSAWSGSDYNDTTKVPAGLDRVFAISAGSWTSYALRDATNETEPVIVSQPQGGSFSYGPVTLSVYATGQALQYQWWKDGSPILSANNSSLSFTFNPNSGMGSYHVRVFNHLGSQTSTTTVVYPDSYTRFLQSLYTHLVQRAPTSAEQQVAEAQLTAGASRASIVLDLLDTPEYQARQWERVILLYYATFNRMPDYPGLLSWSETLRSGSQTPAQVGAAFAGSAEFVSTYGSLTNAQFVQQLYRNVLGREADQLGIDTWGASLAAGMTRGALLLAFADSAEFQTRMAHIVQAVRLSTLLHGRTPYNNSELVDWTDFLRGVDLTDIMLTSSEFQALHPLAFTHTEYLNVIFQGFLRRAPDSATLSGLSSQLQAYQTTRPRLVADLTESGEFNAFVAPVVRFYLACLNRSPDTVGLNHWTHQLRSGTSLAGLADAFALSAEFNSRYGAMSNGQFVSQLYFDTLGRGPDANGLNHWTFQLNTSGESRASMLLTFANSDEAVERFAPNIRSFLHYSTFLNRLPSQAENTFWHDYLSTLELQFIDTLLSSGPY